MTADKTVAAVSTAYGRGGIAVIRISGNAAIDVAGKMFCPKSGRALSETEDRRAVYGDIICSGEKLDDGIAVVYRAPRSYTGEDMVEISCHGGILLTEKVLSAVFECGAEPAGAGEFTQRAFINGKLDLSKAEAVIGLIDAQTDEQLKLSASHTSGVLRKKVEEYRGELLELVSSVYVCIDYPDEDLEAVDGDEMRSRLASLLETMNRTLATYREGRAINEGINTVILGKPNAGKSSLMNCLLGQERAIVTDIAGTTRDTIEEKLVLGKIVLNICDTAGIRASDDAVERIGVDRALKKAEEAELLIVVFDGSRAIDEEDVEIGAHICSMMSENNAEIKVIPVVNKSDLNGCGNGGKRGNSQENTGDGAVFTDEELIEKVFGKMSPELKSGLEVIQISAVSGEGIDELKKTIENAYIRGDIDYSSVAVLANARQHSSLASACAAVERALAALESGFGADVCGLDLEQAISYLGEIDGRTVTELITDQIFHRFCVGK